MPGPALGWDLTFNSREYRSNRPYLLLSYSGGTPPATGTATPTPTHSSTRTVTATPTPSRTGTATASPTATRTATNTRTATGTRTATASPTVTTPTPVTSPTVTGTATGTPTAIPSLTPTPAPCGADSWEPNDTFETAYFVFAGSLQGLICPSTDVDYFQFTANQYDRITLDLSSLPADYNLRLWNPNGSLQELSTQTGTTSERIEILAPDNGSYRAEVFPVSGQWHATDTYELRVQVTPATPAATATHTPTPTHTPTMGTPTAGATRTSTVTPTLTPTHTPTMVTPTAGATRTPTVTPTVTLSPTPTPTLTPASCGADSWEPNDTLATAYFVFPGTLRGLICPPTDVDFFQFSASYHETITLDLDSLPADYNLRLWNPNGTLAGQSTQAGTRPERIEYIVPSAGSYRVEVWPAVGAWHATDSYDLSVQVALKPLRIVHLPVVQQNRGP